MGDPNSQYILWVNVNVYDVKVFVDEAGQASEVETLSCISHHFKVGAGQLILSGDPKQLGPISASSYVKEKGLDKSFLERYETIHPDEHYYSCLIISLMHNAVKCHFSMVDTVSYFI